MGSILNINELDKLSQLKTANQKLVMVGGCFDILHAGHIEFLKNAKDLGNKLIVLLEPDAKIAKLKGNNRPINSQRDRAVILSNLSMVDYVICLQDLESDSDYEALVKKIEPDIIAVTDSDRQFDWEKNSGIRIVVIMKRKENYSTSEIIEKIKL